MCTNPDPDIDLTHNKCVCHCFQKFSSFYLTDKDTNPSQLMSYIYINIMFIRTETGAVYMFLLPINWYKQCI